MRDILNSSKGRTQSQRDYSRDAGDYVPALERRTRLATIIANGVRIHNPAIPAGWNSSVLATAQESRATDIRARTCAHCGTDSATYQLHNGCFYCVGYGN